MKFHHHISSTNLKKYLVCLIFWLSLGWSSWGWGHSNAGVHTKSNLHDISTAFNKADPQNSPTDPQSQNNIRFLVQDLLLLVTLNYYIPELTSSQAIKIIDFIKTASGVWNQLDPIFNHCSHSTKIHYELSHQKIYEVLGLDTVSAETLLHHLESANATVTLTYSHMRSKTGYAISIMNLSGPFCYIIKHQNDLINHGIFNTKPFIRPTNSSSRSSG